MSYIEAEVALSGPNSVKFPKTLIDFEGYVIADFKILNDPVSGAGGKSRPRFLKRGTIITLKGDIPSLHPGFAYTLRFKTTHGMKETDYCKEYEILPKTGFQGARKLPWTRERLRWSMRHELAILDDEILEENMKELDKFWEEEKAFQDREEMEFSETTLATFFSLYPLLQLKSDAYRIDNLLIARIAWPKSLGTLRSLSGNQVATIGTMLRETPHLFAYYPYSKQFTLPELTYVRLKEVLNALKDDEIPCTTKPVEIAAVALYCHLKGSRERFGHTLFNKDRICNDFAARYSDLSKITEAAMHWLTREGHVLFIDRDGLFVPRDNWYPRDQQVSPIRYLQLPKDDLLKERIVGHLRRIFTNFVNTRGEFTLRPVDGPVPGSVKGPLNTKQRITIDHILNNPLTIIQGGPGSGKTFEGVDHLCSLFHWPHLMTHVGRQAVAICHRLGGNIEACTTIHSGYHSQKKSAMRIQYNNKKEILILDEVYNADDRTLEWALSMAPNASRVVMIGDPDQIRPIPDENGAGTPALDIAKAFPRHVIVLDENMRQQASAIAIHHVVQAVKNKQPRSIDWSDDLDDPDAAAVLMGQPVGALATTDALCRMIKRLRKGINGDEHAWQIVTFFNGNNPDKQGLGIKQINEMVERMLDEEEDQMMLARGKAIRSKKLKRREKLQINKNIIMYPGYKFMLTEKFTPDPSINDFIIAADKHGGGEFGETKNGQIEVVKSCRIIQVRGETLGSKTFLVECEAQGKCTVGTRLLINKRLHVDPRGIMSAWAVTTNKSMGGECANVGVYIPDEIEKSPFDRSNIYVAFSRPTRFLSVIGSIRSIEWLVMRDPLPVLSGLYVRLKNAGLVPIELDPVTHAKNPLLGFDWKFPHNQSAGYINDHVREQTDIYDQSGREQAEGSPSPCLLSFKAFVSQMRKDMKNTTIEEKKRFVSDTFSIYKDKVYGGIPDHTKRVSLIEGAREAKRGKHDPEMDELIITAYKKALGSQEQQLQGQSKNAFSVLLNEGRANMLKADAKRKEMKKKQQIAALVGQNPPPGSHESTARNEEEEDEEDEEEEQEQQEEDEEEEDDDHLFTIPIDMDAINAAMADAAKESKKKKRRKVREEESEEESD